MAPSDAKKKCQEFIEESIKKAHEYFYKYEYDKAWEQDENESQIQAEARRHFGAMVVRSQVERRISSGSRQQLI